MLWVGTSGYNYPEWRGNFYPAGFPAAKMLDYYAARFSTVEINYTFYRLPNEKSVRDWAATTPPGFLFTLKMPRRITHDARLKDCRDLLQVFCARARILGPKLGVLLVQLPPYFRKNVETLTTFADWLPHDLRVAFEFRHDSWYTDDVFDILRSRNMALCITDNESATTPQVMTARHAYLRLRDEGYGTEELAEWAKAASRMAESADDVFVYFKHEEAGKGPEFARVFLEHAGVPELQR